MYSHYTSLLYGIVAIQGQGTWACPTFIALMGASAITQSKAREEYQGKRYLTYMVHIMELWVMIKTMYIYLCCVMNLTALMYVLCAAAAVQMHKKTQEAGIPGRVAYMGFHTATTLGTLMIMSSQEKLVDTK